MLIKEYKHTIQTNCHSYFYNTKRYQENMRSRKIYVLIASVLVFFNLVNNSNGSILEWIWPNRNVQNYRTDIEHSDSSLPVIPFEFSETNDRFIMDMSKVLGIRLSDLDFCQQRVILSLKSSCNTLTDEELGKLAIALMNCQHVVEKRETIDCSSKVSLADCVSQMSDDMKAAYGHVLGRTKSVCLAIRQDQFRGMTEITINKLMAQVDRLRTSQNQLERATLGSIDEMANGQLKLLDKQNELLKLADVQKISVEANLREILKEKATLRSGHADLNIFIGKLKSKIEEGLTNLNEQNSETKQVFKDLFDDLSQINEISNKISQRLLDIDKIAFDHGKQTNVNFEGTIQKLREANEIVQNFANQINSLKQDFHSKIQWMEPLLGTGDVFTYRCNVIFVHILYLLLGMLCLVFINAAVISRFLLLGIVLISLLFTLNEIISLNLIYLLQILIALVVINFFNKINNDFDLIKRIIEYFKWKPNTNTNTKPKEIQIPVHIEKNGYKTPNLIPEYNNNEYDDEREEITVNQSRSYTSLGQVRPSIRFISSEFDKHSNYSRSSTPNDHNEFSQYDLGRCKAMTRNGSRCQLMTPSSCTNFCRIHERSSRER